MLASPETMRCFSRERWVDFLDGNVPPRQCEQMALHLETCEPCLRQLDAIESTDSVLTQRLRSVETSLTEDAGCRRMIRAIHDALTTGNFQAQSSTINLEGGAKDDSIPSSSSASKSGANSSVVPELPAEFGRYRLLKPLGQGGMGSVFLAHDRELDRKVALKIPHLDGRRDVATRDRFFREARAAATLEHPRICPIYDVGTHEGTPFLTMQYLPGQTLTGLIRAQGRLDRTLAARLVAELADGLAAAHAHGVIHRDVKPSNVILLNDRPVLTDFGLARRHGELSKEITQSGAVVGSPAYMAPEQARGDQAAIGPATDIYGLGAVLFESLTGQPPVQGTLLEILNAITQGKIPDVHTIRGDRADELDSIVRKALARQIKDRYATMSDFAAALRNYLSGQQNPSVGKTAPVVGRTSRKGLATAIGLVCAACAGLLGIVLVMNRPGTVTIRHNETNADLEVLRSDSRVALLPASSEPHVLRLPPGSYQFQLIGTTDKTVVPDRIMLGRGQDIAIALEDSPRPQPKKAVGDRKPTKKEGDKPVAARPPFSVATAGLMKGNLLKPATAVNEWKTDSAFADLKAAGNLSYPVLPTSDYVLETDFEISEPGQFLRFELGDGKFRVLILADWDEGKEQYKVRLQRRHGRGNWFVNWKFYRQGERIKLRLLRYQGLAMLYDGDNQILGIDSVAIHPQLSIRFGGQSPHGGKIYDCLFRELTAEELAAAKAELGKARPAGADGKSSNDQPALTP